MTFASKKEADAYDKMLDLADNLGEWLQQAPLNLDDEQREGLSFFLAENKDALGLILRGASPAETGKTDGSESEKRSLTQKRDLRQKSKRHNDLCCGVVMKKDLK